MTGLTKYAEGGEIYDVTIDGVSYRVHRFDSVGQFTFSVKQNLPADYALIAGGGGGGTQIDVNSVSASAGGAGDYVVADGVDLPAGDYTIIVGDGGPGSDDRDSPGDNGEDTEAFGKTAIGGGGGGSEDMPGEDGGSGGGAGRLSSTAGQPVGDGQGHPGGAPGPSSEDGDDIGAGGGGAGGPGDAASSEGGTGVGGDGVQDTRFGPDAGDDGWFCSGGSGGAFDNPQAPLAAPPGGGGAGANAGDDVAAEDGKLGTGGGGGGGAATGRDNDKPGAGGKGGSGAVYVRYLLDTITGNATTAAGDPVEYVSIYRYSDGETLGFAHPDENGDWEALAPAVEYGVLYAADGYAPVTHGPYQPSTD